MSRSVNKVMLIGRLGHSPSSKDMASGDCITTISLATSSEWKDSKGEKQSATEWHKVVFFKALAKIVKDFVKKGDKIYVEGSIKYRKYKGKDGTEKTSTDIHADKMVILSAKEEAANMIGQQQESMFDDDEDVPF